jgi:hypothetical protein
MGGKHSFDVWLWMAALFAAIGLLSLPDAFPTIKAHPEVAFVVPAVLALAAVGMAFRAAMLEEKAIPPKGRERRMTALIGLVVCAIGFICFAAILYFWPTYSVGGGAIPPTPGANVESKDVQSVPKPELRLVMLGANVFVPDAPDLKGQLTGIALDARIWNTGAPSVATSWSLVIIPKNGGLVPTQFTKIPPKLTVKGPVVGAVIKASDALDEKTNANPISTVPVDGTLLFYVKLPQNVVKDLDTRWELTVEDIYGKPTTVAKTLADWLQR